MRVVVPPQTSKDLGLPQTIDILSKRPNKICGDVMSEKNVSKLKTPNHFKTYFHSVIMKRWLFPRTMV